MQENSPAAFGSRENSGDYSSSLTSKLWKGSKVLLSGFLIGSFDAWEIRHLGLGHHGLESAIFYQIGLMMACVVAAIVSLYDKNWSPKRNALSLLVTAPLATIADNVSLDLQTRRPYLIILPRMAFDWRSGVFGHTLLSPLANWVNLQSFAPGLIDGYVAAFVIGAVYVLIQFFWNRV
jgi:hypothetical protein